MTYIKKLFRWRTKQNLDYAYLMMYAQAKGTFYVQVSLICFVNKISVYTLKNILTNVKRIRNILVVGMHEPVW